MVYFWTRLGRGTYGGGGAGGRGEGWKGRGRLRKVKGDVVDGLILWMDDLFIFSSTSGLGLRLREDSVWGNRQLEFTTNFGTTLSSRSERLVILTGLHADAGEELSSRGLPVGS